MSSEAQIAYATFPDAAVAERICVQLVTERLVTCANILGPVASIYIWNETLERSREVAAILKFSKSRGDTLAQRFRELHPFATPALVYLKVGGGNPDFLSWVAGK